MNSLSRLSCPPAPEGPRHSGLQLPPHAGPHKGPHSCCTHKAVHSPVSLGRASRPRPPPAARHWLPPLPVRHGVLPTTALPGSALRRRSFPTAGTLRQLLIGPARQPLILIGGSIPHRRGRILSQRGPIGPCRAHVGGALLVGPPLSLPRPKPQDGPGSR